MANIKLVLVAAAVLFAAVVSAKSSCLLSKCSCSSTAIQCMDKSLKSIPSGTWSKVESLWLSGNKIKAIDADFDKRFPVVTSIDLGNNRVTVLDLNSFVGPGDKTRRITLDLWNNYIEKIVAPSEEVITITFLNLQTNRITSIDSDTFLALPNLASLHLSDNPLLVAPGQPVLSNSLLRSLSLNDVGLGDLTGLFTDLPALEYLYLENNAITDIQEEDIPTRLNINSMALDKNPLRSMAVGVLWAMTGNGGLYLTDTPLVCECAHAELAAAAKARGLRIYDSCDGVSLCGF